MPETIADRRLEELLARLERATDRIARALGVDDEPRPTLSLVDSDEERDDA